MYAKPNDSNMETGAIMHEVVFGKLGDSQILFTTMRFASFGIREVLMYITSKTQNTIDGLLLQVN